MLFTKHNALTTQCLNTLHNHGISRNSDLLNNQQIKNNNGIFYVLINALKNFIFAIIILINNTFRKEQKIPDECREDLSDLINISYLFFHDPSNDKSNSKKEFQKQALFLLSHNCSSPRILRKILQKIQQEIQKKMNCSYAIILESFQQKWHKKMLSLKENQNLLLLQKTKEHKFFIPSVQEFIKKQYKERINLLKTEYHYGYQEEQDMVRIKFEELINYYTEFCQDIYPLTPFQSTMDKEDLKDLKNPETKKYLENLLNIENIQNIEDLEEKRNSRFIKEFCQQLKKDLKNHRSKIDEQKQQYRENRIKILEGKLEQLRNEEITIKQVPQIEEIQQQCRNIEHDMIDLCKQRTDAIQEFYYCQLIVLDKLEHFTQTLVQSMIG